MIKHLRFKPGAAAVLLLSALLFGCEGDRPTDPPSPQMEGPVNTQPSDIEGPPAENRTRQVPVDSPYEPETEGRGETATTPEGNTPLPTRP